MILSGMMTGLLRTVESVPRYLEMCGRHDELSLSGLMGSVMWRTRGDVFLLWRRNDISGASGGGALNELAIGVRWR